MASTSTGRMADDRPAPHPATPLAPALIQRHPVASYFILTFAISWGGLLLVDGRGLLSGSDWQTDPLFLPAIMAMVAGPTLASLLLTGLVAGAGGYREVLSRLARWRIGAGWYALPLLVVPLLAAAVPFALALASPVFLPRIATADDRASVLVPAVAVGLVGGLLEELGWTGFAIPRLLRGRGAVSTGLIVGVLWGAWHLLQMIWVSGSASAGFPSAVFLPLYILFGVAQLAAYRVLMVWVYDRTGSLFMAVLMHASYIAGTLYVFGTTATGASFLIYGFALAGALWVAVVVAAVSSHRQLSAERQLRARTA